MVQSLQEREGEWLPAGGSGLKSLRGTVFGAPLRLRLPHRLLPCCLLMRNYSKCVFPRVSVTQTHASPSKWTTSKNH